MSALRPLSRGIKRRCPACGEGKLFNGYLKLVEACECCGQTYDHDKAADGPAWLTVLRLGPFFAPLIFLASLKAGEYAIVVFPTLLVFLIATALTVLAFMKGAWIGALWHMGQSQSGAK